MLGFIQGESMSLCNVSPDPVVNRLVENCGYATAALTLLPIPGSEIIGVVPLHVGMVIGIANHHGRTLNEESAMELLLEIGATVGLSLVGSRLATTAAKIVLPGLGGLVAAPFMFASTLGLGAVADAYFREGSLSEREMKDIYNRTRNAARRDFDPAKAKREEAVEAAEKAAQREAAAKMAPATPTDPVERLKRARDLLNDGLITQEDFDGVKRQVLESL
jgi:uncharacterized protein (DUF697 family)